MFRLQDMRDTKKLKWPIYIMFGIVIVSFVFFYGWQKRAGDHEFNSKFARMRSDSRNPFERWTTLRSDDLKKVQPAMQSRMVSAMPPQLQQTMNRGTLQRLITPEATAVEAANLVLLERKARDLGINVSQEEVIKGLEEQPGMTNDLLARYAASLGTTPLGFIEMQRESREEDRTRRVMGLLAHASLFELWQEYQLINEKLTMQVAAYPITNFEGQVVVTDQDLTDYLAAHLDDFRVPTKRRYSFIKLPVDDIKGKLSVTDEQLQVYYEQNQDKFTESAASKIDEIYMPLSGDTSSTAATALLEETLPLAQSLDDWTTITELIKATHPEAQVYSRKGTNWLEHESKARSPQFMSSITTLPVDTVSTPILDTSAAYLVRITERREAGVPPLDQVRDRVEEEYRTAKGDEEFEATHKQWKGEIRSYQDLHSFAVKVALNDELTTWVEKGSVLIPEVGMIGQQNLDHIMNLHQGELSDVIMTDQMLAVLQVVEEVEEHEPTLDEARDRVERALRQERARELARAAAEQARTTVAGGADFATALADAPQAPFTTDPFRRAEAVRGLGAALIGFPRESVGVGAGTTGVSPYGFSEESPFGYAVWKVTAIEPADREQFKKDRAQFSAEYLQLQREIIIREWLADLRRSADFEIIKQEKKRDAAEEVPAESPTPEATPAASSADAAGKAGNAG